MKRRALYGKSHNVSGSDGLRDGSHRDGKNLAAAAGMTSYSIDDSKRCAVSVSCGSHLLIASNSRKEITEWDMD